MSVLKPAKQTSLATLQIKIPPTLASRLTDLRQQAANEGMALDVDQHLAKALVRLLRSAEQELAVHKLPTAEGGGLLRMPPEVQAAGYDSLGLGDVAAMAEPSRRPG